MAFFPRSKIIVLIDFSDESFATLNTAMEIADDPSHVRVLHVLEELHPYEIGQRYGTVTHHTREQHILQAFNEHLTDPKYENIGRHVVFDNPLVLFQYRFTDAAERRATGNWWHRETVWAGPAWSSPSSSTKPSSE